MFRPSPPFRPAGEADAPTLAILINEASHGLAHYAWTRSVGPGADAWAFGVESQRARVREGLWTVADESSGPVAGLQLWPPGGVSPSVALPALFAPFVELRALAPAALYINVLATLPQARGRGLGTRLMGVAAEIAAAEGAPGLSLIVSDANSGARRLYGRLGFRERAARPMVKEGWTGAGAAWLLLVKPLP
jgi:ribosomal protein S18 acetylase RimI-like enzyme